VEDNFTVTVDYLPAHQAPQAVMATPEQIDRIMQNHDEKHRELLAKMDSLRNMIASIQQFGHLHEQHEVEAVASKIEAKVAEFGQFSERDIKKQLAHVSGMATVPEEQHQQAEVVADKVLEETLVEQQTTNSGMAIEPEEQDKANVLASDTFEPDVAQTTRLVEHDEAMVEDSLKQVLMEEQAEQLKIAQGPENTTNREL
jgi:hypothetical protein